jgi:Flp pilus assembly protein TadB
MTTGLQLMLAAGILVGAGVAFLIWRLAPAEPDLADALRRLSPEHAAAHATTAASATAGFRTGRERIGVWAMRTLPAALLTSPPRPHLAILRMTLARFYGEKVIFALVGLSLPAFVTTVLLIGGFRLPFAVPVIGSIALAAGLFFVPDYNVRDDAKKARAEFSRALGAYIDLVALERASGSGARQAMEVAATVGDSWVFRRLAEELARSRWSGVAPWEALHTLGTELGLPELDDLADIMRLSGEEGAQIYANLRARSAGMRSAMLHHELGQANAINERLSIPMSLLGAIFLAMLVAPALLRLVFAGAAPSP